MRNFSSTRLVTGLSGLLREQRGATATEYAVMLALVIAVCIASITVFGQSVRDSVFGSVNALFGGE